MASVVPDGYKIVKVRKPDGTIVKVRRRITKLADPPTPSSPSEVGKQTEGQSSAPNEYESAVNATSSNPTSKSITPQCSGSSPSMSAAVKPAASPVHASKLETTAKSYRLFQKFHRVHQHASRIVEAFDPYLDVGDLQDGDEYLGSDDYSDDSNSEDSSDDDHNDQNQPTTAAGSHECAGTGGHLNVSTGNSKATQRSPPATKQAKTEISVQEVQTDKSFSTEIDPVIREKELLGSKDLEAAQPKPPRSLRRRSANWTTLVVWAIVIIFPFLFIGKSALPT